MTDETKRIKQRQAFLSLLGVFAKGKQDNRRIRNKEVTEEERHEIWCIGNMLFCPTMRLNVEDYLDDWAKQGKSEQPFVVKVRELFDASAKEMAAAD